jgi:potassium large conductance calcium-activated channel subfamily M alpha protein 1
MVAKREPSSKYMSTNPSTKGDADEKENTETKLTFMQRAEATRVKLKKFMAASIFGSVYDYCFLFLSVISAFSFIAVTYLDPRYYKEYDDPYDTNFIALSNSWEPARQALAIFEMVLATMFGFDLCLALYLADHKLELLGSYFFWVDLLTVVPTYATYGSTPPNFDSIDNFRKGLEFVLHAATTARLLRLLRIRKYLRQISDDIRRLLSDMVLIILVTIIFDAGLMQYLEAHAQRLLFHEWMYMFVVTISTVGYGDIAPDTVLGRLVVMLMIIFSIVNIPQMTNTLIEKMKYTSVYTRARYVKKSHTSHLLICGNLRSLSLVDFFSELFHEDHEIDNVQAVILANSPPWHEMQQLLTNPSFSVIITYLQGSALNEDDLARAHAESALAIFILTDKFSTQPFEQDAKTILQQFSIERYINHRRHFHSAEQGKDESTTPNVPVQFCTEVIRAENRKHLAPADAFDDGNRNVVVCLNEIKMGIIANTILYPGSCAILFNLLNSFADTEDDDVALGTETGEIEYLDDDDEADWIGEYKRGCDWEIYTTAMAGEFSGLRFNTLSYELYMSLGITLFGLQITDLQKGIKEIFINPGDMIVPDPELYYVEGLVIAKNKAESDLSVVGEMGFEVCNQPINQSTNQPINHYSK